MYTGVIACFCAAVRAWILYTGVIGASVCSCTAVTAWVLHTAVTAWVLHTAVIACFRPVVISWFIYETDITLFLYTDVMHMYIVLLE